MHVTNSLLRVNKIIVLTNGYLISNFTMGVQLHINANKIHNTDTTSRVRISL